MKRQVAAAELDQLVDRVDGGAGDVVDDDPLLAGELVEQRATCRRWACRRCAIRRGPPSSASARAAARAARRGRRRAGRRSRGRAARRPGSGSPSPRFHSAAASASVRWSSTLLAARTTGLPDLRRILTTASSASVMPTVASTTNSTASASGDRDLGLGGDPLGQAPGVGVPAAGVDDRERAAVPVGVVGDAVAGHAGDVLDDGLAAADDPVDQRRLADVGAADDGQHRQRAGSAVVGQISCQRLGHVARAGDVGVGHRSRSLAAAARAARDRSAPGRGPVGRSMCSWSQRERARPVPGCAARRTRSTRNGSP